MRKLISFLGREPMVRDGVRQDYREAKYRFDDSWTSGPVKHLAQAVAEYSQHISDPFEEYVFLGTPGSMWDVLIDGLGVTNGYRHLAMIGLGSAAVSAKIKDAKIEEIAYGAFDMTITSIPIPTSSLLTRRDRTSQSQPVASARDKQRYWL